MRAGTSILFPTRPTVASTVLATLYVLGQCSVNEHVMTKSPGYEGMESGVMSGW